MEVGLCRACFTFEGSMGLCCLGVVGDLERISFEVFSKCCQDGLCGLGVNIFGSPCPKKSMLGLRPTFQLPAKMQSLSLAVQLSKAHTKIKI